MQEMLKSTPAGRKMLRSRLQLFQLGPLIPYMEKYITKDMDTRYGFRMLPQGGMAIGNFKLTVTNDVTTIGEEIKKKIYGYLYELLFIKEP